MKQHEVNEDTMAKEIVENYSEYAIERVRRQLTADSNTYHDLEPTA